MKLEGKSYKWKDNVIESKDLEKEEDRRSIGFIAQEVNNIIPEVIRL